MSYFTQNGDAFRPTPGRESILTTLPTGNYVVAQDPMGAMFFQRTERFTEPGKLYGDVEARTARILNTFLDRDRATGVLLAGEKGSGKSLLARNISYRAYEQNIPTILVNMPWVGDGFSSLLADVEQPAIVLMDEFEKVYDRNKQEGVLTLLDGAMTSKKLFVLTVNDKWRVDEHMRNRPGRLFYAIDYGSLEAEFVREYCVDNLNDQTHTESVVRIGSIFEAFNFDMLKALVEDMNRYKEDPFETMELLNAKPMTKANVGVTYSVQAWEPDGTEIIASSSDVPEYDETPISSDEGAMYVQIYVDDDTKRGGRHSFLVKTSDVVQVDGQKGTYEFKNAEGYRVIFTKNPPKSYDLRRMVDY